MSDVTNPNEWKDISNEQWRTYRWESGATVTVVKPKSLFVSANGHRIVCEDRGHYVPMGWIHLEWAAKPGEKVCVA
jgi:hypothetical protein